MTQTKPGDAPGQVATADRPAGRAGTGGKAGSTPAITDLRCYYLHPLDAGPMAGWPALFGRIAGLGFSHLVIAPPFCPAPHGSIRLSASHDRLHPALAFDGTANAGLASMAAMAAAAGLALILDVQPRRVAAESVLATAPGSPFSIADTTLDPRRFDPDGSAALAPLHDAEGVARLAAFWADCIGRWADAGVAGVRIADLRWVPAAFVRRLAELMAERMLLIAAMDGLGTANLADFVGCGVDYVTSSLPWWDGQSDWYWREDAALRRIAPVIAATEQPYAARIGEAEADPARLAMLVERRLNLAALLGSGWMMVGGSEHAARLRLDPRRGTPRDPVAQDLSASIMQLNRMRSHNPPLAGAGEPRVVQSGGGLLAVVRPASPDTRLPADAALVAISLRDVGTVQADPAALLVNAGGYYTPGADPIVLDPGGASVTALHWQSFAGPAPHDLGRAGRTAALAPRIAIEAVTPRVDGGFPARRCLGEQVEVQADIICDGHDVLAAAVRYRVTGTAAWQWARMRPLGNDRWAGSFTLARLGLYEFTVEAWKDVFATYRDELSKKYAAGLDVTLELEEGRLLVAASLPHADGHAAEVAELANNLRAADGASRTAALLSDNTAALMRTIDPRQFATWVEPPLPIEVERTAARFASWYEIFPRSMSGDTARHGTFDDVIAQLPRIQAMGFDVLYFPPVHPIGAVNRKGPNNSLTTVAGDPGSPYGIADHTALHAELGTFDDFARLRDAAGRHGLELALDFAVQCAPDHPWLAQHRGWFDWRPDGSIRYAENPPKKYQDIVNVDFYKQDAIDGLWAELCRVVLFWCDHGIRIFRVDNPHTKPLPFWHWLITEVRARFPDTMFLAEAFTKPKMMNRLAKIGFSQSYTYFTWRNTKAELQEYLTELTTTDAAEYFRPNFFVNTPDINPVFLQTGGRAAHLIRAALAATLAGLWGVYSGFELCDATPLPGREEYLDSEKYQLRVWDWARSGNIVAEITRLNWMRRLNPALQTHLGVTFLECRDDRVICFEKATADRSNVVLVAICLDPAATVDVSFDVPLWRWQLPDHASVRAEDLVHEASYHWHGRNQHVRLSPANPYAVWRVSEA